MPPLQEFESKIAGYTQPNLDFAAPERVLHDAARTSVPVDAPCDMWSLGMCWSCRPSGHGAHTVHPPSPGMLVYALWNNGRALHDNKRSLLDYKHHLGQRLSNQLVQAPPRLRYACHREKEVFMERRPWQRGRCSRAGH